MAKKSIIGRFNISRWQVGRFVSVGCVRYEIMGRNHGRPRVRQDIGSYIISDEQG